MRNVVSGAALLAAALAFPSGAPPLGANSTGLEDRFAEANRMYEAGRFSEAAAEYEAILRYGIRNEVVHFNLGNAYFKMNNLGRALLNYERALRLAPGDRETRENLEYGRSLIYDRLENPRPPLPVDFLIRAHRSISRDTETVLFLVLYVGAAALLSGFLLAETPGSRKILLYGMAVLTMGWLVIGASLGAKFYAARNIVHAIVVLDSVDVRSGPGETQTVLFTVHEGLKARVRNQRDDWLQVSLPNGWNGWVPRDSMGII